MFYYTIHITILFKGVTVMGKHFSEDSRVKIPALVHLSRLGYQYLSTKEIRTQVHKSTNIFPPSLLKALLECIDNKINSNNNIISTLESLSKTLYDYYFLQFDFPDEKGRPYKSSGGKMEYNSEEDVPHL